VAHDFNNLLTAILGSTDLLLEELAADHPGRLEAEETRKAALRAADLTRQLLAFSRQQVLAPQVLDINEVVTHVDKMLAPGYWRAGRAGGSSRPRTSARREPMPANSSRSCSISPSTPGMRCRAVAG